MAVHGASQTNRHSRTSQQHSVWTLVIIVLSITCASMCIAQQVDSQPAATETDTITNTTNLTVAGSTAIEAVRITPTDNTREVDQPADIQQLTMEVTKQESLSMIASASEAVLTVSDLKLPTTRLGGMRKDMSNALALGDHVRVRELHAIILEQANDAAQASAIIESFRESTLIQQTGSGSLVVGAAIVSQQTLRDRPITKQIMHEVLAAINSEDYRSAVRLGRIAQEQYHREQPTNVWTILVLVLATAGLLMMIFRMQRIKNAQNAVMSSTAVISVLKNRKLAILAATIAIVILLTLGWISLRILHTHQQGEQSKYAATRAQLIGAQLEAKLYAIETSASMLADFTRTEFENSDTETADKHNSSELNGNLNETEADRSWTAYRKEAESLLHNIGHNIPETSGAWIYLDPQYSGKVRYVWFIRKNGVYVEEIDSEIDIPGYLYSGTRWDGDPDYSWWYIAADTGRASWTNMSYDIDAKEYGISYSRPVYANSTLIGVTGIDISIADLNRQVDRLRAGDRIFVMDSAGELMAGTEQDRAGFNYPANLCQEQQYGVLKDDSGTVAFQCVRSGGAVFVRTPQESSLRSSTEERILLTGIAAILVLITIVLLTYEYVSRDT